MPWRRLMAADRFDLDNARSATSSTATAAAHGRGDAHPLSGVVLRRLPRHPARNSRSSPPSATTTTRSRNGRAYRDVYVLSEEGASGHATRSRGALLQLRLRPRPLRVARHRNRVSRHRAPPGADRLAEGRSRRRRRRNGRSSSSIGLRTAAASSTAPTSRSAAAFAPIFEQNGVQLVLNGHDHDYERTLPMKTSTRSGRHRP